MGPPQLSRLDTFDTRMLSVDLNTPLARAINAKWNEDAFLREFGRLDDSINDRDSTRVTRDYLNQEFKRRG